MNTQTFEELWHQFKAELLFIMFLSLVVIFLPAMASSIAGEPSVRRARVNSSVHAHDTDEATKDKALSQVSAEQSPADNIQVTAENAGRWPIRGKVTAEFGIPHRPWQHRHSGIDISSGQRSGNVPVKAFREGKVVQTVRSSQGLGNHVIIDHGDNIISYYAHLSGIAVRYGQIVAAGQTVGHEGNTGASTGTHLHFEIRLNDIPVNPRRFLAGNP